MHFQSRAFCYVQFQVRSNQDKMKNHTFNSGAVKVAKKTMYGQKDTYWSIVVGVAAFLSQVCQLTCNCIGLPNFAWGFLLVELFQGCPNHSS